MNGLIAGEVRKTLNDFIKLGFKDEFANNVLNGISKFDDNQKMRLKTEKGYEKYIEIRKYLKQYHEFINYYSKHANEIGYVDNEISEDMVIEFFKIVEPYTLKNVVNFMFKFKYAHEPIKRKTEDEDYEPKKREIEIVDDGLSNEESNEEIEVDENPLTDEEINEISKNVKFEDEKNENEKEIEIKEESEDEPIINDIDFSNVKFNEETSIPPLLKAMDVFNEIVQNEDNKEYLKQIPELAQEAIIDYNPEDHKNNIEKFKFDKTNPKLNIYFKKRGSLFDLKESIRKCINNNTKDNLVVKIWFRSPFGENQIEYRTITLANEEGFYKMSKLLDLEEVFKLEDKWSENEISVSGDNGGIEWQILAKDIIGLQIYDKRFLDNFGRVYKDNGGKFYKYKINKMFEDNYELIEKLKRYQIFKSLEDNKNEFEYNCLIYALNMSGWQFGQMSMDNFKDLCYDRYVSMKDVDKLGKLANIKFNIVKKNNKGWSDNITGRKKIIGSDKTDARMIKLALIDEHYILNEEVQGINKFYLKNYDEINKACSDKPIEWRMKVSKKRGNRYMIDESKAHMKSYEFVEMMTSDKIEWNFEELKALPSNLWNHSTSEIKDLSKFSDIDFIPFEDKEQKEKEMKEYYYADTECDVSGEYHKAFCISYTLRGLNEIKTIIGENCLTDFLNILPNNAVVYFHNLGYDAKMFSDFNLTQSIDKGTKTMNMNINYKGKFITFKDSYSILSMKLAKFPKTFGLKCGEKEMFPYNYYTFERLKNRYGLITEAGKNEKKWDQKQFEMNIDKLGIRNPYDNNKFDMYEYVKFYCEQDVNLLAQGFDKFREMCLESLQIDIDEVLTAPSLANQYFEREIYKKIPNFYKYSGTVRAFIQKAIYGGRCMTRDNEKWKVENCELLDYDARSLYPSAMNRLYCQTGKCEVLEDNELDLNYLLEHTANENEQPNKNKYISSYVVEIEITKVGKHLHFPLIVVKDKKTGINRNTNDAVGVKMVVDNIMLEDFVKFQNVECKIIRGYKWTDEKDFTIRKVIRDIYDKRIEYKKQNNALQEVYKLIMNSAYGKMIQKPIVDKNVYKKYQTYNKNKDTIYPLNDYIIKNSAKIKEIIQINKNIYLCKVAKQIETFATNTLLGVQVLSMSKRIMNEVMCLAEDLDIKIYYQDTDSMHLEKSKFELLKNEFYKKYGRELDGDDMGQFHSDFDELADSWAYKSIFNGKKCYIDLLTNEKGEKQIHYRMKGVSLDCVEYEAKERKQTLYELYNNLFDEETIKFNLLATGIKLKSDKIRRIKTLSKFERRISFKGKKNLI